MYSYIEFYVITADTKYMKMSSNTTHHIQGPSKLFSEEEMKLKMGI